MRRRKRGQEKAAAKVWQENYGQQAFHAGQNGRCKFATSKAPRLRLTNSFAKGVFVMPRAIRAKSKNSSTNREIACLEKELIRKHKPLATLKRRASRQPICDYVLQAARGPVKLSSLTLWVIGNRNIITDSRSDTACPRRR